MVTNCTITIIIIIIISNTSNNNNRNSIRCVKYNCIKLDENINKNEAEYSVTPDAQYSLYKLEKRNLTSYSNLFNSLCVFSLSRHSFFNCCVTSSYVFANVARNSFSVSSAFSVFDWSTFV